MKLSIHRKIMGLTLLSALTLQSVALAETQNSGGLAGGLLGAVLGGVAGHQVGKGRGNAAATAAGAVAGALLGSKIGNSLSAKDQEVASNTSSDILTNGRVGEKRTWRGENGYGTITVIREYRDSAGRICRVRQEDIYPSNGQPEIHKNITSCRQGDAWVLPEPAVVTPAVPSAPTGEEEIVETDTTPKAVCRLIGAENGFNVIAGSQVLATKMTVTEAIQDYFRAVNSGACVSDSSLKCEVVGPEVHFGYSYSYVLKMGGSILQASKSAKSIKDSLTELRNNGFCSNIPSAADVNQTCAVVSSGSNDPSNFLSIKEVESNTVLARGLDIKLALELTNRLQLNGRCLLAKTSPTRSCNIVYNAYSPATKSYSAFQLQVGNEAFLTANDKTQASSLINAMEELHNARYCY